MRCGLFSQKGVEGGGVRRVDGRAVEMTYMR